MSASLVCLSGGLHLSSPVGTGMAATGRHRESRVLVLGLHLRPPSPIHSHIPQVVPSTGLVLLPDDHQCPDVTPPQEVLLPGFFLADQSHLM